ARSLLGVTSAARPLPGLFFVVAISNVLSYVCSTFSRIERYCTLRVKRGISVDVPKVMMSPLSFRHMCIPSRTSRLVGEGDAHAPATTCPADRNHPHLPPRVRPGPRAHRSLARHRPL